MPLDFPSSPSVNDTYTYEGKTWIWNGSAWLALNTAINNTAIGDVTPDSGAFTTLSSTGDTTLGNIEGNLIPASNVTYNLGSNTARWNDLWLANSTINIGNASISADGADLLLPSTIKVGTATITESGGSLVFPAGTTVSGGGGSSTVTKITSIQITDSSWNVLDNTAVDLTGGYIIINGTDFVSGCTVFIDDVNTVQATSVSFVSSSLLRCQVPAKSAGTYNVLIVNPSGSVAIAANGITYSGLPGWNTGSNLGLEAKDVSISIQLSATDANSYVLQSGSSLPPGISLSSSGLISGTVTGITEDTTYNFTIEAVDTEFQESPRTFSIFITATPRFIYVWGFNTNGYLGLNDLIARSSPTQLGSAATWKQITAGFSCLAVRADGTLWAWGLNNIGQLGLSNLINRSSPVQVGSSTDWASISIRGTTVLAKKTNNSLWAWGAGTYGQLGLGGNIDRSSPVQVGTDTNWDKIVAGASPAAGSSCIAIRTNGTLWAWGKNDYGQLGLNTRTNTGSPAQVGTATDWVDASISDSGIARKSNGTLWLWGRNNYGQLGLTDTINRSSPVQLGSLTDWDIVNSSPNNSGAKKTDGTVWVWGFSGQGQLGLNDTIRRSSPVQLGSDTDWKYIDISGGYTATLTKTDNTLWITGYNNRGQLGLNDTINRSSPVQIGTSGVWYTPITASVHYTVVLKAP